MGRGGAIRHLILLTLLVSFGLLLGCSNMAPVQQPNAPAYHIVKRGETLFRIAWHYGLDYRDIAAWNHLKSPDLIMVGQRLRLTPPGGGSRSSGPVVASRGPQTPTPSTNNAPTPATVSRLRVNGPEVKPGTSRGEWDWPTRGRVVTTFDPTVPGGKGIDISGRPGQPVRAAASGQVVYKGSGLRGYGQLIIVKHSPSLLSAYGYLGRIFVNEGDRVRKGQAIAELGNDSKPPVLHFEIRKNGKPVDPMQYLPG